MPSKNTSKNTSKKTEQKNYSQMENGDILQTNINEEYLANMPLHKLRKLINKYNDNNNGNKIGATLSKHKFLKKMLKKEGIKQKSHTICCPICSKTNQDIKLFKCGGCKSTHYCSKEHQKQDWNNHKSACKYMSNCKKHNKTLNEEESCERKRQKKFMEDIHLSFQIEQSNPKQKRVFHKTGLIFRCVEETQEDYIIEIMSINDFREFLYRDNKLVKNFNELINNLNNGHNIIIYKDNINVFKFQNK
jgi:hypothetical protein